MRTPRVYRVATGLTAVGLGVLVAVGAPTAAFAHGVGGTSSTVTGFVALGFWHMLLGWDHLLFIGGVLLLAGTVRRAAKLISVFALGHSITLIVATLARWQVDAGLVDVVLALSLAFLGTVGWLGRPAQWRWFAVAVFGFGLVHGLGLSTRLQQLGVHHDGALARVVAFNIGVELAQLVAVLLLVILGDTVWRRLQRRLSWPTAWRIAHATLVVVGLIAGAVVAGSIGGNATSTVGPASLTMHKSAVLGFLGFR